MSAGSNGSTFFDKTYDEALALTEETHAYLSDIQGNMIVSAYPMEDLCLRCESFRLTTRLMQVVAWLLTQRAIHAGELSASEVANGVQYRLGATDVCRDDSHHRHPAIPSTLTDMLDRSLNLYIRVERLDGLMHSSVH